MEVFLLGACNCSFAPVPGVLWVRNHGFCIDLYFSVGSIQHSMPEILQNDDGSSVIICFVIFFERRDITFFRDFIDIGSVHSP